MDMLRFLVVIFAIMLTSAAFADEVSRTVKAGETVRIYSWSFFNKDCSANKFPKFTVRNAPSLGSVSTKKGTIKVRRVSDPAYNRCIGRSVEGTLVMYTAGATKGVDRFSIARRRLNGRAALTDFVITVK